LLIDKGCPISDVDGQQMTVLMHQLRNKPFPVITKILLMKNNAINVNAKDINGMTALMHYVSGDSSNGYYIEDTLKLLVENGCSIEDVDHQKMTVLMHYVRNKPYIEVIQFIILKSDYPDAKDIDGMTALMHLVRTYSPDIEVVEFFVLECKANIDIVDNNDHNAHWHADQVIQYYYYDKAQLLAVLKGESFIDLN
jgi:ankyrin repeat protein